MLVRVLGDVEVEVDGVLADLGGPKPRVLLGLLVAAGGRPVPVEQLIDQVWGERPPARVEASLQSYVARLRRSLEPGRAAGEPARRLRTYAAGYSLEVLREDVDADRFVALVRDARTAGDGDPAAAVAGLEQALALWRGEAYAACDAPALRSEAIRLEELRLGAVADLWALRLRGGTPPDAVAELEQLVGLHPLQERLWGLLVLALYRAGRQGDALAALRRVRTHLADELGVDPGPELRRLEQQVLQQNPELDAAVDPPAATPAAVPPAPSAAGPPADHAAGEPAPEPATLPGRDRPLAEVDQALAAARAGRGRVVLVSGEPGIGKTRLAETVLDRARAQGLRTGWGGWEPDATAALRGWTVALREAIGRDVLAGSETSGAEAGDAASVSYQQADRVLDALGDGPPTVLVLDDAHWADQESLRLLRRVAGSLSRVPAVVVVTTRRAAADIDDDWAEALAALARVDPLRIDLAGLDPDAVARWVSEKAGRAVSPAVADELVRRTDGNPFYVTELVRLLVSEGALGDLDAAAWRAVPSGVRDVVRQRSRLLAEPAADLLASAAVVGRGVDLAVLEALGEDPEQVAEAVESAQVLGLLDDDGPGRVRFTHALVRDALYESLTAPVRAVRHARVAAALETAYAGRIVYHAAELADHYRLAGPVHARSAWVFARQGSEAAAARSSYDEALRLATMAAELQEVDPTVSAEEREGVWVARARALGRVSRPMEAWAPTERAARSALARGDAGAAAAALHVVMDQTVWGWRPDATHDEKAMELWREVLDRQPADAAVSRAHLLAGLAVESLYRPGDHETAPRIADQAVATVRRSGAGGREKLLVLRIAHIAMLRPDLLHHRMPLVEEMVELASAIGDPADLCVALTTRAHERADLGRLADARSDVTRAHELAVAHHLLEHQVIASWDLLTFRQLDGDPADLADLPAAIDANGALHASLASAGDGIALAHHVFLLDGQGRLPELEPVLRELRRYHPAPWELHALSMARAGRLDELRTLLGSWAEQPPLAQDYHYLLLTSVRADTWIALGDEHALADLYADLLPYADRLAVTLPVGFRGSVRLCLGRLAAAAGDPGRAREHLERARETHAALGLPAWVGACDDELARL